MYVINGILDQRKINELVEFQNSLIIIGNSYNSDSVGPNTISLEPTNGTDTHGRFAFKIHGERRNGPSGQASKGCIIQSSRIRNKIINSGDRKLKVIAR